MKVFARRYRSQFLAVSVASIIGIFALVVDMTFTAEATVDQTEIGESTSKETPSVDLDSLYAAKASEESPTDTALSVIASPQTTFAGHVSWYGPGFHGRRTANGERFDMNGMTAAHKRLPFNTIVRVVDNRTGHAVLVRINDRGPYVGGRVLDLSKEAASRLGMRGRGTTSGTLELYEEHFVDERITSISDEEQKSEITYLTFDAEARGAQPNGWSVNVAELSSFDQSVDLYDVLRESYDEVFLSKVVVDGTEKWSVAVGLYGTRYLGEDLLLELTESYPGALLMTFENGLPVSIDAEQSGQMAGL